MASLTNNSDSQYYVRVENLVTRFFTARGIVKALDGVSLSINKGEIFGLVGESGCGKSVTANSIMDLIPDPPGRIVSGNIYIDGFNIISDLEKMSTINVKSETNVKLKRRKRYIKRHNYILSRIRGKKIAMIFQEPFLALNPVITVGDQIMESIMLHDRIGITNSIIRRETIKPADIDAFVDDIMAMKSTEADARKKLINRWTRQFGLAEIELSLTDLFENEKERDRIRSEVMRLAASEQTGIKTKRLFRAREYYKMQEDLFELNLKQLEIENELERDVRQLSSRLTEARTSLAAARAEKNEEDIGRLNAEVAALKTSIKDANSKIDRTEAVRLRKQIRQLKTEIVRKHLAYVLFLKLLRKRAEKPFKVEARKRALELLQLVNIAEPTRVIDSYPHELSGGMQQRVMIAMALSSNPKLLIADEPTTALDVTTQAQILDLIKDLRNVTESSVLFITHDLAVIAEMCDRVGVMYAGNLVEEASSEDIFFDAKHPYTQGLLKSIPKVPDNGVGFQKLSSIPGGVPNLITPPTGCRFHPRCPFKMDICEKEKPLLVGVGKNHKVACWLYPDQGKVN